MKHYFRDAVSIAIDKPELGGRESWRSSTSQERDALFHQLYQLHVAPLTISTFVSRIVCKNINFCASFNQNNDQPNDALMRGIVEDMFVERCELFPLSIMFFQDPKGVELFQSWVLTVVPRYEHSRILGKYKDSRTGLFGRPPFDLR
ncbi:uncharacterized protein RCC_07942 [Ramularia collo-cygni]|uniref:Uncharacterized protein n=1 Tax=Ramularia collo-cygni TaxID=112498 RepID=A0A2D3VGN7_9PEZI|nr:uncharacterized protein RCC_07942 [Ramularia collo-cygni]CZT22074.1 uncharacterized protein RCC_07942 [Ramularia collo-cygni]